jgi:transcriptional regulator with XRE-family HTH domain
MSPTIDAQNTQGFTDEQERSLAEAFRDEEYRYAYAEDFLNTWVATQIVTLREQRQLNQTEFGRLIGTKQPGVSRLEDVNHSTWKTETLKRIARALGVRLKISFETFGSLLEEDQRFNRNFLERPKFEDDPAFIKRKDPMSQGSKAGIVQRTVANGIPSNIVEFPLGQTTQGNWAEAQTGAPNNDMATQPARSAAPARRD